MSGSPKYCTTELGEEIDRQLRDELKRLREEERRQRAEAERARREQAIRDRATALQSELDKIQNSTATLLDGLDEFFDPAELSNFENRVGSLNSDLARAVQSPAILKTASREFKILRREIEKVAERARSRQLESNLQAVSEQTNYLQNEFNQIDRKISFQYDQIGLENVESLLRQTRTKVSSGDLQGAKSTLISAQDQYGAHRDRMAVVFAKIEEQRSEIQDQVNEALEALVALESNESVIRWKREEIAANRLELEHMDKIAKSKDFHEVPKQIAPLLNSLKEIEESASEAQLAAEKRNYITSSIQSVMKEFGFEMESGFPCLQDADSPASDQVILARRLSGEKIAATVPLNGEVWYDVTGYRFQTGVGTNGNPTSSCDGAQAQIEAFHEKLGDEFGVKMGKLRWDDQDPDRILNEAKHLPRDHGEGADRTQANP